MALADVIGRLAGLQRIRANLAARSVEQVLPAYHRRRRDSLITSLMVTLCILYAFVSGYFLGIFQQYILLQFLAPCALLAIVALWAAPDRIGVPHHHLEKGFFITIVATLLWPVYLAIVIPGLPWITLSKLILFLTLLCFGVVIATDRQARSEIAEKFGSSKLIRAALIAFVAVQFATVPLSPNVGESLSAAIGYQFYWTGILLMTLLILDKPGRIDRFAVTLLAAAAVLCLIAIWEHRIQHVPWAGHLPSFVHVSDPIVEKMISGGRRAGDGLYRVQTTYTTSLSCAEFMALVVPFLIHYFLIDRRMWMRALLAMLYCAVVFTIVVTRSRLGMIGFGIAHLAYPFLIGIRRWSMIRNDLIGPSLIALYPGMLLGFMGLLMASRRLYIMFLGGGQHQASNDAREFMYDRGIPLILTNPWGFGANAGAGVLNYRDQTGQLSLDSYYLTIGLDYGVVGFIAFYGMLITAIYLAVRVYLTSRDNEARIAAPVAIALGSYLIIKSVLSQSQNQFLMFALVGVAMVLNHRYYRAPERARRPGKALSAAAA